MCTILSVHGAECKGRVVQHVEYLVCSVVCIVWSAQYAKCVVVQHEAVKVRDVRHAECTLCSVQNVQYVVCNVPFSTSSHYSVLGSA